MPRRFPVLLSPRTASGIGPATVRAISERLRLEVAVFATRAAAAVENETTDLPFERHLVVLVVDDDPDLRAYLARSLRAIDLPIQRVLEAADGIEALGWLAATPVHLVVSDVVMPRLDGFSLHAHIRSDPELRDLPILLVSGEVTSEDVLRRMPSDAHTAVLEKPFNARSLRDSLAGLLR